MTVRPLKKMYVLVLHFIYCPSDVFVGVRWPTLQMFPCLWITAAPDESGFTLRCCKHSDGQLTGSFLETLLFPWWHTVSHTHPHTHTFGSYCVLRRATDLPANHVVATWWLIGSTQCPCTIIRREEKPASTFTFFFFPLIYIHVLIHIHHRSHGAD